MSRRRRWWAGIGVSVALGLLVAPGVAPGDTAAERQLAQRYSPIVVVRAQRDPPCDATEEQYRPTTVDTVLGNPRVTLVAPKGSGRPPLRAPTAADVAGKGKGFYLNLPGDPLDAGCRYARDFQAIARAGRAPAITYAHVRRQPGEGLFVQYWFYYYFNQFNDVHESDWEGMQISFGPRTARQALASGPEEIGLFQHGSGERADWSEDKVEKEGTHPVVYSAAGSHATFFAPAVYVENGQGGSGLGCDNTTGPWRRWRVRPVVVPTQPARGSPFQWLTFTGRWGQRESGFNNGPTGPNTKPQWLAPADTMDGLRLLSPKLPGGSLLGPAASTVFCGAVATVSGYINLAARTRLGAILVALAICLLVAVPALLTRWRPVELSPLRATRRFGQLIRAARRLYGRHWRVLLPIGLTAVPIVLGVDLLRRGADLLTGSLGSGGSNGSGIHLDISGSVASIGVPVASAVVSAAVIAFVRELERGRPAGFAPAWRAIRPRFWALAFCQLLASLAVGLIALTIVGIPIAIRKYVDWQFVQQEILFEDRSIRDAFRGSTRLVRGRWWRTVRVAGFLWLLSVAAGPVLGFALIFANFSLTAINFVGSVVFALLIPYVALGRTLLYFDLGARRAAEPVIEGGRRRWRPWRRAQAEPGVA